MNYCHDKYPILLTFDMSESNIIEKKPDFASSNDYAGLKSDTVP
jgi:hypothetical protein